jgi:hypothetical protein
MDLTVNKLTTALPDAQSSDAGCQTGKTGPSKFDKIQSQLVDPSGGDVATAKGTGQALSSSVVSRVSSSADRPQSNAATVPDRVRQNLAASGHNLGQLKARVEANPDVSSMQSLQGRLSSIEHQYTRLDSAAKTMPPNASDQQWLALQQQVYAMNENIGVLSKMVGQVVSGVKSVLQTQV